MIQEKLKEIKKAHVKTLDWVDRICFYLWIVQVKVSPIGRPLERMNPYNPLAYLLALIIGIVGFIVWLNEHWNTFTDAFKWEER